MRQVLLIQHIVWTAALVDTYISWSFSLTSLHMNLLSLSFQWRQNMMDISYFFHLKIEFTQQ